MAQEFQEVVFRDTGGKETIRMSGHGADIFVRANANDANIVLEDQQGRETIRMSGHGADIFVRANANDANIVLQDQQGKETIRMSGHGADIFVRANANDANIVLQDQQGRETIRMSGNDGRIEMTGGLSAGGLSGYSLRLRPDEPDKRGLVGELVATEEGELFFCKGTIPGEGNRPLVHWVNLTGGQDRGIAQ